MQPGFLAGLFSELAQLTRSGVPLPAALDVAARASRQAARVGRLLAQGRGAGEAFAAAGFQPADCAVIEAGTASGRLDRAFTDLALRYKHLASARRQILARSLYPIVVIHLAAILLSIPPAVLAGEPMVFVRSCAATLGGFYLVLALLAGLWKGARWFCGRSPAAARAVGILPGPGGLFVAWSGAAFASVFAMLVRSGGSPLKALEIAGRSCGNALLAAAAEAAVRSARAGGTLSPAFEKVPPSDIARALRVGEHAGRLDEESAAAAAELEARALAKLGTFAEWTPRILYVGILLFVAWRIVATAIGIGETIGSALDL